MSGELDNNAMIQAIAAKALGQPAPGAAPAAQAPQPQQAPQAPKADPAPTSMEKAQAKVAPSDPQTSEAAINFLKIGDREYTEDQLKGTMGRYKDLNYKWQTNKPVMDVISSFQEAAKKAGHDSSPDELAKLVDAAVRAYVKDPTMGGQKQATSSKEPAKAAMSGDEPEGGAEDTDAAYESWEKENAVKLPPGFKETASTSKAMSAKMDKMMELFQQVIQGGLAGQQSRDQATQQVTQAQGMQADAATKMISNNLTGAFGKAGVPLDDAARADFRMFAAQRGYDFPDFMDPELASVVVADYKANKDAPEVTRLREMARKRQAFTGMTDGAPGAGGAPAAPAGDPMLAEMINTAMGRRNM